MSKKIEEKDIIGKTFGLLIPTKEIKPEKAKKYVRYFLCECQCKKENKNQVVVELGNLMSGHTRSCGCLHHRNPDKINKTNIFIEENDIVKICSPDNLEEFAIIDKEDLEKVKDDYWIKNKYGYWIAIKRKDAKNPQKKLHEVVFKKYADHIDLNLNNNRKSNLRQATKSQNAMNKNAGKNNTSGYKGVSFVKNRNKYRAYITLNQKQYFLGYYDNAIDAARAYNKAALKLHGEFARLNEIKELEE